MQSSFRGSFLQIGSDESNSPKKKKLELDLDD